MPKRTVSAAPIAKSTAVEQAGDPAKRVARDPSQLEVPPRSLVVRGPVRELFRGRFPGAEAPQPCSDARGRQNGAASPGLPSRIVRQHRNDAENNKVAPAQE